VSAASIKIFVGVTDLDWFKFLSRRSNIEEANFWQPGGRSEFRALHPGELFLFKLHSPNNFIVGGGLFGHASIVPISLAWEAFGEMNGATSLEEMRRRVARYRRELPDDRTDYPIGCRILEQPFFWPLREHRDWCLDQRKQHERAAAGLLDDLDASVLQILRSIRELVVNDVLTDTEKVAKIGALVPSNPAA